MQNVRFPLLFLLLAGNAGCHLLVPYRSSQSQTDAGGAPADAGIADARAAMGDGGVVDARRTDLDARIAGDGPDAGPGADGAHGVDGALADRLSFRAIPYALPGYVEFPSNAVRGVTSFQSHWVVGTDRGVALSNDEGQTWRTLGTPDGVGHPDIKRLFRTDSTLYAGTFSGLYGTGSLPRFRQIGGTENGICGGIVSAGFARGARIVVCARCSVSFSQNGGASFLERGIADGLPTKTCRAVYIAPNGRVYVGTEAGLAFTDDDGESFDVLTTGDGLPSDRINDLKGSETQLLVATDKGLLIASDDWSARRVATGLVNNDVRRITIDDGDRIWLATAGGISSGTGDSWDHITSNDGLPTNEITDLALRRTAGTEAVTILAGTPKGLAVGEDGSWRTIKNTSGPATLVAKDVAIIAGKQLWATDSGLLVSTDGGLSFSLATGLPATKVRDLHVAAGTLYLATQAGLAWTTDAVQFQRETTADGLSSNDLRAVHVNARAVYVATPSGVNVRTDDTWHSHDQTAGLLANSAADVHAEGDTICVAHGGSGLSLSFDHGDTWVGHTDTNGLSHTQVNGCHVHNGTIYAATYSRLCVSENSGADWRCSAEGMRSRLMRQVEVQQGKLFVSNLSGFGISSDDGRTFSSYTSADGLPYWTTDGIFIDGRELYVATQRGVAVATLP